MRWTLKTCIGLGLAAVGCVVITPTAAGSEPSATVSLSEALMEVWDFDVCVPSDGDGQAWQVRGIDEASWAAGRSGRGLAFGTGHRGLSGVRPAGLFERGALSLWIQPRTFILHDPETRYSVQLLSFGSRQGAQLQLLVRNGARNTHLLLRLMDTGEVLHAVSTPARWQNGRWHHLALTWTDGRFTLWSDGEHAGAFDAEPDLIERLERRRYFSLLTYVSPGVDVAGVIDEVSIYSRALSATELATVIKDDGS